MSDHDIDAGMATLSIDEALFPALNDAKIFLDTEVTGVLGDAVASHNHMQGSEPDQCAHLAAAALNKRTVANCIAMRR